MNTKSITAALVALAALLTFAPTALAGPNHPPLPALDIGGLNHACGAAVDSQGDVYASSAGESKVKVFSAAHTLLASIPDTHEPCGLAVNSKGELFVSEQATGNVVRYKPNAYPFAPPLTYGAAEPVDSSGKAKGISVDRLDDRLYVAEGTRIASYNPDGSLGIDEVQRVLISNASGGTFTLKFGVEETAPIPFEASAAEAQAKLEALSTIGAGNVAVVLEATGKFLVTFTGARADSDVATLGADGSGLTGPSPIISVIEQTKGFDGHIGEGALSEASGVAAYSYASQSPEAIDHYLYVADAAGLAADRLDVFSGPGFRALKLHRELNGASTPDGSFGFGPQGAYLAADPGNGNSAGKCVAVAEQACTAGHLFLYDATHKALDEFDASGEYLDQTTNAAFADAEPSAIALDRSGGAGDGTVYVSEGAGAGTKLLAFGPLAAPSRTTLAAPVSHVLKTAQAVATDSHGDVYARAGAFIHVFKPDGTELLRTEGAKQVALLEDPHFALDLAVDSTGRVYVLDENKGFGSEREVTYYTPSAYPPTATTTYTRHEPALVTVADFVNKETLKAIAVNPGPASGKDHLFVAASTTIHEYDSAAQGSTLLNGAFAAGTFTSFDNKSIAVDGTSGNVYVGRESLPIEVVSPDGKELLARISGFGAPKGPLSQGPTIAVDQANGHLIGYVDTSSRAQEYDASGAFVAEFGSFTPGLTHLLRVAVDGACAIHEPPLDESTSPTCHEYDPADGTVYVASDDTAKETPDVWAFGPLAYGQAPTATTGIASGLGAGGATLNGTVNPNGFAVEECRFEYIEAATYDENEEESKPPFEGAEEAPCEPEAGELGVGSKAVAVQAAVSLPDPESTYRFRLLATNKYGEGAGDAVLFGAPAIEPQAASPILYTEATLRAKLSPSGLATHYHFEYGTEAGVYGQSTPAKELPGAAPKTAVFTPITGLAEATEYHFRLVAENEAATVQGPDRTLVTLGHRGAESCENAPYRIGLSANLPDCRAYELVTPAQTNGLSPYATGPGDAGAGFNDWLTAQRGPGAGGDLAYFTDGTLPGFEGNGLLDGYRAERGAGAHPSAGWASRLLAPTYRQSVPNFAVAPVTQHGLSPDQLYSFWQTKTEDPLPESLPKGVYLRTPAGFEALGRGDLGEDLKAVSKYVSAGGSHAIFTSTAQLEPEAPPAGSTAIYDRAAGSGAATVVSVKPDGSSFGAGENAEYIAATEDGAAVLFKVGGTLYLHREGATTEIAPAPSTFAGISADGGRVFYAATANGEAPASLYACDVQSGPCAGAGAHAPAEIAPNGIFANVSADGSHAFFSSAEALSAEVNENGEEAEAGAHNLYGFDAATETTRFIARLSSADFETAGFAGINPMNLRYWTTAINPGPQMGRAKSPTRSTPDGTAFAFQSHARLTGYDNAGAGEIYLYAPAAEAGERLTCASCDPSGASPSADALFEDIHASSPLNATTQIANLTDDGQAVFFQSPDRLLPEDANEVADVYEWKAKGAGACTRPGGCLALISSGQGESPSYLYSMSADGHDVFIATQERLLASDAIGSPSIYDAREGGGIPEPSAPAPCQGDACQGDGSERPALPAATTSGQGNGNAEAQAAPKSRCAKGKKRVKGRCVKPHAKKKQSSRKRANHDRRAQR